MVDFPPGRQRTPPHHRERAKFGMVRERDTPYGRRKEHLEVTLAEATRRLTDEARRSGFTDLRIECDLHLKDDGTPYARQRKVEDPGVVVYFTQDGIQRAMPCDQWDRIEDNLVAVAKSLEAKRGMVRWGATTMEAEYAGYAALPPSIAVPNERSPYEVLGVSPDATPRELIDAYRERVKAAHPDHGGTSESFIEVRRAGKALGLV